MSIFDRLRESADDGEPRSQSPARRVAGEETARQLTDEQAVARYRYLLQTAPPEAIEQAHEEAFAKLTPAQRRMVLEQLSGAVPQYERPVGGASNDDPRTLARMATRTELRQPGTLERIFGAQRGGIGMGGMLAGGFFSSLAGTVIGSMIAQQFLGSAFGYGDSALAYGDNVAERESVGHADASDRGDDAEAGTNADADMLGDMNSDSGGDLGGGFDSDLGGDFGGI